MKKNNKKGFTIVELVIVIAVIGILAAVLIPTFGNVISDAKESAALQDATNLYKEYLARDDVQGNANYATDSTKADIYIKSGDYWFKVTDGKIVKDTTLQSTATSPGNEYEPTGMTNIFKYKVTP